MNAPVSSSALADMHAAHKARAWMRRPAAKPILVDEAAWNTARDDLKAARLALVEVREQLAESRAELTSAREELVTLREQLSREVTRPWREILDEVCAKHGVTFVQIAARRRSVPLVLARQELWYRMSVETHMSLPEIGRHTGGFDHSTALHGIRRHRARLVAESRS